MSVFDKPTGATPDEIQGIIDGMYENDQITGEQYKSISTKIQNRESLSLDDLAIINSAPEVAEDTRIGRGADTVTPPVETPAPISNKPTRAATTPTPAPSATPKPEPTPSVTTAAPAAQTSTTGTTAGIPFMSEQEYNRMYGGGRDNKYKSYADYAASVAEESQRTNTPIIPTTTGIDSGKPSLPENPGAAISPGTMDNYNVGAGIAAAQAKGDQYYYGYGAEDDPRAGKGTDITMPGTIDTKVSTNALEPAPTPDAVSGAAPQVENPDAASAAAPIENSPEAAAAIAKKEKELIDQNSGHWTAYPEQDKQGRAEVKDQATREYNEQNGTTTRGNAQGAVVETKTYDSEGNVTGKTVRESNASGDKTTTYDEHGNVTSTSTTTTTTSKDENGKTIYETTTKETDGNGRIVSSNKTITNPDGSTTTTESQGNTTTTTETSSDGSKTVTTTRGNAQGAVVESKTYDENGRVVSSSTTTSNSNGTTTVESQGNTTTTTKVASDGSKTVTTTRGNSQGAVVETTTYDSEGNVTGSTHGESNASGSTSTTYDANGRMISSSKTTPNADGSTTTVESQGNTTTTTEVASDGSKTVTTTRGNSQGAVVETTSYDSEGNVAGSTHRESNASGDTITTYDAKGRTVSKSTTTSNPDGSTTTVKSQGNTTTTTEVASDGSKTETTVNSSAQGAITKTVEYNPSGQVTKTTESTSDARGNTTKVVNREDGTVTETKTDPSGNTTSTTRKYDPGMDNIESEVSITQTSDGLKIGYSSDREGKTNSEVSIDFDKFIGAYDKVTQLVDSASHLPEMTDVSGVNSLPTRSGDAIDSSALSGMACMKGACGRGGNIAGVASTMLNVINAITAFDNEAANLWNDYNAAKNGNGAPENFGGDLSEDAGSTQPQVSDPGDSGTENTSEHATENEADTSPFNPGANPNPGGNPDEDSEKITEATTEMTEEQKMKLLGEQLGVDMDDIAAGAKYVTTGDDFDGVNVYYDPGSVKETSLVNRMLNILNVFGRAADDQSLYDASGKKLSTVDPNTKELTFKYKKDGKEHIVTLKLDDNLNYNGGKYPGVQVIVKK